MTQGTTNLADVVANIRKVDVSGALQLTATGISPLIARLFENGQSRSDAKDTKHEWFEDKITPTVFTVASATSTTVTMSDTAPTVGMIIGFSTSAGVARTVAFRVDSVAGLVATGVFVEGAYGTLAGGDIANVIQNGTDEGRTYGEGNFHQGPREYNFLEIFEDSYQMSGTLASIEALGNANDEATQIEALLKRVSQKYTKSVLRGFRYEAGKKRYMGSIDHFLRRQGSANTLGVSTTFTADNIETMLNTISQKIGEVGEIEIWLNPKWGGTIRGFNTRTLGLNDKGVGGSATEYHSVGGRVIKVNYDDNILPTVVYFLDMTRVALIALPGRRAFFGDYQINGDFVKRDFTSELTLELRNAKEAHGCIVIS